MKKILIISLIIAAICSAFSFKVIANNSDKSLGYIEYNVPNTVSGTMTFNTFSSIYNTLPRNLQELFINTYVDVNNRKDSSFYYNGVLVKHPNETTWEFYYNNCTIKVYKVTVKELNDLFLTTTL